MRKLIIDSSTNLLYVGLIDNNHKDNETRLGNNDNAAYLVDKIDILLKRNNLTINNIDEIIVGVGPGSYTGIRVAVTVAKMLAYTKNINLKTISSLLLLSSGYEYEVTACIDARRNHVFSLTHNKGIVINDDKYINKNDLLSECIDLTEENIKVNLDIISNYAKEVTDVHNLEPNYLRKTEAEVNYDKKSRTK